MPVCPYCSAPIEGQPIALDADLSCAACGRQLPEQRRADHPASSPSHLPVLAAAGKLWTVADQAVISATNFVTMLLLARQLTPSAFGEFTLVYTGFLFANILQNTLVSQPMNMLGPAPAGAEYARYLSGTLFSQIIIMSIELLVCAALAATAYARGWHIAPLLLGVAPAVVAWQLQEFVRRALYVQDRLAGAFMNDLIAYGTQSVATLLLWRAGLLSGALALYVLAGTSLLAVPVGIWQIRASLGWPDLHAIRKNLELGRWLAGAAVLAWCSSLDMYLYVAVWIVGSSAAGELRVAILFFGPARVLSLPIASLLPIQFARITKNGDPALRRAVGKAYMLVVPVLGGYCLMVALTARPLLRLVGTAYESHPRILVLYAAASFVTYLQMVLVAALTAKHLTRVIFIGTVVGAVFASSMAWPIIRELGAEGALVGLLMTNLLVMLFLWRSYRGSTTSQPVQNRQMPDALGLSAS